MIVVVHTVAGQDLFQGLVQDPGHARGHSHGRCLDQSPDLYPDQFQGHPLVHGLPVLVQDLGPSRFPLEERGTGIKEGKFVLNHQGKGIEIIDLK